MMMTPEAARALLQVPTTATPADVERSFRRRARELHPDLGGDAESFHGLVQARAVLQAAPTGARGPRQPVLVVHRGPWWRRLMHALRAYVERRQDPPAPRVR